MKVHSVPRELLTENTECIKVEVEEEKLDLTCDGHSMPRSSLGLRLRKWDVMKGCWSQGVPPSATFPCSSALHKSSNQMFPWQTAAVG